MTSIINFSADLEDSQNYKNKLTTRSKFFARKIHKLKKMLRPLFSRKPKPVSMVQSGDSIEDLQNAMNEALEARLAEDLAASHGVAGDAIQAIEDGRVTLVVVHPGSSIPVPAHFFASTPGRFSWTFLSSPDYDICPRGDLNAFSYSQTPEQQTPPASPY